MTPRSRAQPVRRGAAGASVPLLMLAALGGCAGDNGRRSEGSDLVTVLYYDELTLYPRDEPVMLVSLSLVNDSADTLLGELARSWEHSADWRTWTYHLRTDVRWHDGQPFTAHDVKFTYDLLQHPDVAEFPPGSITVTVADDSTVRIVYGEGLFLQNSWTTFLPRHLLAAEDPARYRSWAYFQQPVGNGPYRVVRLVPNVLLDYAAVPDHPVVRARIPRVRFILGKSAVTELLSGNVDVAYPSSPELPAILKDPRFRRYHSRPYNPIVVVWNMLPGRIFEDVRVREAVTMALDRRQLFELLMMPENAPLVDGVFTERALRRAERETAIPFDRERARRLLAEAGWRDTDGDGILDRDGRPFRFTFLCGSGQDDGRAAVWLQSQLRLIGVQTDIEALEGGARRQRAEAGRADAYCTFGEAFVRHKPHTDWLVRVFGIGDERLQSLLQQRGATLDPVRLNDVEHAIAERIREYLPITYLFPLHGYAVAHRRLQGLRSPDVTDPVTQMPRLWLADE